MVSTAKRAMARRLRAAATPHERMLWRGLKDLPVHGTHFRRQAVIGSYVVDFLCPAARLIVELDGGHHNEAAIAARDRVRQHWLEQEGYRVIRFWNSDVTSSLSAVLETIYAQLHGSRDSVPETLTHQRRLKAGFAT
jgi:very-short-patch-repair endonuclease